MIKQLLIRLEVNTQSKGMAHGLLRKSSLLSFLGTKEFTSKEESE